MFSGGSKGIIGNKRVKGKLPEPGKLSLQLFYKEIMVTMIFLQNIFADLCAVDLYFIWSLSQTPGRHYYLLQAHWNVEGRDFDRCFIG